MRIKFLFVLVGLAVALMGCATIAERGKVNVVDGERVYIPEEYIRLKGGAGEAEFPSGHKIKAEPPIKLPPLELRQDK